MSTIGIVHEHGFGLVWRGLAGRVGGVDIRDLSHEKGSRMGSLGVGRFGLDYFESSSE